MKIDAVWIRLSYPGHMCTLLRNLMSGSSLEVMSGSSLDLMSGSSLEVMACHSYNTLAQKKGTIFMFAQY